MEKVFSTNRIVDTLKKYDNHKINSLYIYDDCLKIELEFISTSKKSKTETSIKIYCDNYFELEKENEKK